LRSTCSAGRSSRHVFKSCHLLHCFVKQPPASRSVAGGFQCASLHVQRQWHVLHSPGQHNNPPRGDRLPTPPPTDRLHAVLSAA
jgi:hypothetical protein